MTRKQYDVIQAANMNIFPCYSLFKKAKQECYMLIFHIGGQEKIIWQNPVPYSTSHGFPIRIRDIHATNDFINDEIRYIDDEINSGVAG